MDFIVLKIIQLTNNSNQNLNMMLLFVLYAELAFCFQTTRHPPTIWPHDGCTVCLRHYFSTKLWPISAELCKNLRFLDGTEDKKTT